MTERVPKVGDHVILRFVGAPWEINSMKHYLGTEQEISECLGETHNFRIRRGNEWVWCPENIERWLDDLADPPDDTELSDFIGF